MSNRVEHPSYYQGQGGNGIECIEIIRHYTCDIANAIKYLWRAGLKREMGMDDAEKEIEDLQKGLFYIEDYRKNYAVDERSIMCHCITMTLQEWGDVKGFTLPKSSTDHWIKEQTGHTVAEIIQPYEERTAYAIGCLLHVGLICDHHELTPDDYIKWLDEATEAIQQRILDIEQSQQLKGF